MNIVVIEHVALDELPAAWLTRNAGTSSTRIPVRIEEVEKNDAIALSKNPLFGLWRDREETKDVACYARQLRAPNMR